MEGATTIAAEPGGIGQFLMEELCRLKATRFTASGDEPYGLRYHLCSEAERDYVTARGETPPRSGGTLASHIDESSQL